MLLVVDGFSSPRVARTPSETRCRSGLPMAGSKLTDTPYMSIRCADAYSLKKMCCSANMMLQTNRYMTRYLLHIKSKQDGVVHMLLPGGGIQRVLKAFVQQLPVGLECSLFRAMHHYANGCIYTNGSPKDP